MHVQHHALDMIKILRCCYLIFNSFFYKIFENPKITKKQKIYIFNIFTLFLAFLVLFQNNLI
jgi:hypothetical protein